MSFLYPKPRIKYNGINIDFDALSAKSKYPKPVHKVLTDEVDSGIEEHLSFYTREHIVDVLDFVDAQKIVNELRQFYEYAKGKANFEYWRDRNLGGYFPFEGNLYNNNRVNGTYTQALSSGAMNSSYLDPDTRLVTFVANTANTPRFPAGKFGRGIILENQRKNELNTDFSTWTVDPDITRTVNTPETKDPEGGGAATKFSASGVNNDIFFITSKAVSTNDAAAYIFLKSPSGTVNIPFEIQSTVAGTLASGSFAAVPNGPDGNGFTKFQISYESGGSVSGDFLIIFQVPIGSAIYAYAPGLEVGIDVLYPTSPIKGNALTRNGCTLSYPATNLINRTAGAISFWFKPQWAYNKKAFTHLIYVQNANSGSMIRLAVTNQNWEFRLYYNNNNSDFVQIFTTASVLIQNAWNHIVMNFDPFMLFQTKVIRLYANGTEVDNGAGSSAVNIDNLGTYVFIGAPSTPSQADGIFDDVMFYGEPLTAGEVKYIYNMGRALGLERKYFPALRLMIPDFDPEIVQGTSMYSWVLEALEVLS